MSERMIRLSGATVLYESKAPFVPSGVSILGAIEYDEVEDKLRCHECGEWFYFLGPHLNAKHGMDSRAYKLKHGLKIGTALVCERVRQDNAARGKIRNPLAGIKTRGGVGIRKGVIKSEYRNVKGLCQAQVIDRLKKLGEQLGRVPTQLEMEQSGLRPHNFRRMFSCSAKELVILAGMTPRTRVLAYSDFALIEMLRDFFAAHKRVPTVSDHRRKLLPSRESFAYHFGSWQNALRAAGLEISLRKGFAISGKVAA